MGAGTVLWWVTAVGPAVPRLLQLLAAVFGYLGFAGVVVFGLFLAISDVIDIVA